MVTYLELLCGLVLLATSFYYYLVSNFDFWKKRGVRGPEPQPVFGTLKDLILARVCAADLVEDLRKKYRNDPVVGLFNGRSPILVLHDPEIIKTVLIKDFTTFQDRPHKSHERTEPLSINLFQLDSARWRWVRPKLRPMFTLGKLKGMFSLMVDCSDALGKQLDNQFLKSEVIEVRDLTARFATDVIGSCVFGIKMNCISEENSEFREKGKIIVEPSTENIIRLKLRLFLPWFYDLLGFVFPDKRVAPFFNKVIMETMNYRRKNNVQRHDFIHLLTEVWDHPERAKNHELTDQMLVAQAFTFFAAGFETTSITMSWTLLELALNHDIQEKLREELKEYMKKFDGKITYETMKKVEYLDKVLKETLRKYPPGMLVQRTAISDYTFEALNFSIPKSTEVWIPVFSIHRNPDIYPDPTKFDPERFTEEAVGARHPMHYLPFGAGPRNCIGGSFAIFKMKLGLLKILLRYKVDICDQTKLPHEFDPSTFSLSHKGGIYLKMTKI